MFLRPVMLGRAVRRMLVPCVSVLMLPVACVVTWKRAVPSWEIM